MGIEGAQGEADNEVFKFVIVILPAIIKPNNIKDLHILLTAPTGSHDELTLSPTHVE